MDPTGFRHKLRKSLDPSVNNQLQMMSTTIVIRAILINYDQYQQVYQLHLQISKIHNSKYFIQVYTYSQSLIIKKIMIIIHVLSL